MHEEKMINILKAKIHDAVVTEADLHYEGSIGIDQDILDMAAMHEFEKVDIYNITNGKRFSTYIIAAARGSKSITLNGAAARKVYKGDRVIISAYTWIDESRLEEHRPVIVLMDEGNNPRLKR